MRAVRASLRNKSYYSPEIKEIVNALNGEARKWRHRRNPVPSLTARQIEIVLLLCDGKTSGEIANELGISRKTANNHRADILHRTRCRSTADLVRYAIREGIVEA